MVLRGLVCRLGNKLYLRKIIYPLMPKDFDIYIEPFVGSGAVYFGLFGTVIKKGSPPLKAVLNDKDKEVMTTYRLVKRGVKFTPVSNYSGIQRIWARTPKSDSERLAKAIIGFCYRPYGQGDPKAKLLPATTPAGGRTPESRRLRHGGALNYRAKNIDRYREALKHATLLSQDYISVVRRYDRKGAFFYFDPPYDKSGEDRIYKKGEKKGEMDYEKMANVLRSIKGRFILSINDSANMRRIFKGFKIKSVTVHGYMRGSEGARKELLIRNY